MSHHLDSPLARQDIRLDINSTHNPAKSINEKFRRTP
jgi:hypothetical protein